MMSPQSWGKEVWLQDGKELQRRSLFSYSFTSTNLKSKVHNLWTSEILFRIALVFFMLFHFGISVNFLRHRCVGSPVDSHLVVSKVSFSKFSTKSGQFIRWAASETPWCPAIYILDYCVPHAFLTCLVAISRLQEHLRYFLISCSTYLWSGWLLLWISCRILFWEEQA